MKLKQKIHISKVIGVFSIVVMWVLLLALFSTLIFEESRINLFFSSDTLYLPSIYKDIFIDKNSLDGWHFNPAPNFFPDMLFYFIFMLITNDFITSTLIFSLFQLLVMGFLIIKILKFVFPQSSGYYKAIIYMFLSFILLETFFYTRDLTFVFNIIINSYHTGSFLMALFCFILSLHYFKSSNFWYLIFIFFLATAAVFSDRLFIVLFVVPISLTSFILFKSAGIKNALALLISNAISILGGQALFKLIDKDNSSLVGLSGNKVTPEIVKSQFYDFYTQISEYLTHFSVRNYSIKLFMLSFLLIVYVFFESWRKKDNLPLRFVSLFIIFFSVIVICVPMLSGKYEGWDCLRYNLYPFLFTGLNISLFFAYKIKNTSLKQSGKLLVWAGNLVLVYIGISQFSSEGLKGYFNYYPENARLIDYYAEKENLKFGVANYWDAKKVTMFSKKNVKVYSVYDDAFFYEHVVNINWFYDKEFDFVLLNRFSDTTHYRKTLKDVRFISNTPTFKLVKTRPFTYSRFEGSRVINKE